jgi:hypothetical protein
MSLKDLIQTLRHLSLSLPFTTSISRCLHSLHKSSNHSICVMDGTYLINVANIKNSFSEVLQTNHPSLLNSSVSRGSNWQFLGHFVVLVRDIAPSAHMERASTTGWYTVVHWGGGICMSESE